MECPIKQLAEKCPFLRECNFSPCLHAEDEKDYVIINGLKWDRENTVKDYKEHFNFYEALGIAQVRGKRLPTKEEFEVLIALGSTWDFQRKGIWFGHDHWLKSSSRKSVFFPADGYRGAIVCDLIRRDFSGIYWSGSKNGSDNGYGLYFNIESNYNTKEYAWQYGFSVRCISEL
jgi:uncharacterized protein (TIGR02145 family)